MSSIDEVGAWIADELPGLIARYKVPGAAVAVLRGDEVVDAAAGVLSLDTKVEATPDTVFQIGSITKVWTATLVMQLVGEGKLDLDAPVRKYLPEFRLADESAAEVITARQLLSHTAGFEGDIFTETGVGDDCVEKFLPELAEVPQLFPPGERFSYNNAGFVVLGRLVEVLRGKPYDTCLRERLFAPLGLTHAATSPYEAIMFRAAVGHVRPEPGADPVPAPVWALARSNAPAGAMLAMRPRDLLGFARMHLGGGTAPDGSSVLDEAAAAAMRERQVGLPKLGLMGDAWGLGWELFDSGPMIGHDGGTIGQSAFLRVVPEQGVAVALFTNGGDVVSLYRDVMGHVLRSVAGVELPAMPVPPADPPRVDASRYVGTYSARVVDMVVSQDGDGRIWVEQIPKGIFAELGEKPDRRELVAFGEDRLIPVESPEGIHTPHCFVGDDGAGHALFLHVGRALRRAGA
jgi:CubicO group peptidase (beta-lactamase class C family)